MKTDLVEYAKQNSIKYFLISFTDVQGVMRSKLVPTSAIGDMQTGGAGFAGFAAHLDLTPADSDLMAVPDSSSVVQLPWKKDVAWVSSRLVIDGGSYSVGPRDTLIKVMEQAQSKGMTVKTGVECEFFLLDGEEYTLSDHKDTQEKPCYDQLALMRRYDIITQICDYMEELGWGPYQNDHEDACGQFEMNWGYADAVTTADRHAFFKFMVRNLAEEAGYRATFMPKPFSDLTGNGCHTHLSIWDNDGNNIFHDPKGELGLSQTAYHFIGGLLHSANALSAFTNPTINSFKRINAPTTASGSTWSPNSISYAGNNRTHMIRIPENDRIEVRLPDGAANPYILPAALIAAGMEGIASQRDPGTRQDTDNFTTGGEGLPKLPKSFDAALGHLSESAVFRESLGGEFVDSYMKLKHSELALHNGHVTDWELQRYLDI